MQQKHFYRLYHHSDNVQTHLFQITVYNKLYSFLNNVAMKVAEHEA